MVSFSFSGAYLRSRVRGGSKKCFKRWVAKDVGSCSRLSDFGAVFSPVERPLHLQSTVAPDDYEESDYEKKVRGVL
jgi:hypothetical protein